MMNLHRLSTLTASHNYVLPLRLWFRRDIDVN